MTSLVNSTKHLNKNTNPSQTIPKNRRKNTSTLILQGQYYADTKAGQEHYKKRKLQANILNKHSCKNFSKILANQIQQYIKRIIHHDQEIGRASCRERV